MKMGNKVLIPCAILLLSISIVPSLLANHEGAGKPSKTEVLQKTKKLHMPFIANDGQMDEQVRFYANTFGGTVFVTKDGEIVYSLPERDKMRDTGIGCRGSGVGEGGYGPRISSEYSEDHVGWIKALSFAPYPPTLFPYQLDSLAPNRSTERSRRSPSFTTSNDNEARTNGRGVLQYALTCLRERDRARGISLKEGLVGGKISGIKGEGISVTKVNYFKGNDPSKWKSNIPTYDYVNLGEVYEGIGLRLKAYGNNVEKLFCVKPGANPDQIKIRLNGIQPPENPPPTPVSGGQPPVPLNEGDKGGRAAATFPLDSVVSARSNEKEASYKAGAAVKSPLKKGARGLSINEHGALVVETEFGPVKFTKPIAYQEIDGKRVEVRAEYVIRDREPSAVKDSKNANMDNGHDQWSIYGFKVAAYDKTKELVIDPLLASTFLGGSYEGWYSGDEATALVLDTEGNVYVAGITYSRDFPVTNGAYDTSLEPSWGDVFVSKLDSGLTSLIASTFLGGWNTDLVLDLALDSEGNVYVTGKTDSWDFPTTSGAYDTSFNRYEGYPLFAPDDAFVSKLNSGLTRLLASTFLGGSDSDYDNGNVLALDTEGNVYVTGTTYSRDFPTTSGAYDTSLNGGSDVFISKLNSGLTKLIASTLLGGSDYDVSEYGDKILALDKVGNVYVTGDTRSSDFPTTVGAYDTTNNGVFFAQDAFVSKLDSGLTNLLASTFLRGLYDDESLALTLDTEGNVYVAGYTYSSDFPTTSGAYDTSFADSGWYMYPVDSFVSKLDSGLANLIASTFLGGYDPDLINALALDSEGNVYVAGNTYSSLFPITSDAYDTSLNYVDAFVSKLDRGLTNLLASTFLGGLYDDESIALALDSEGNVYVTGKTDSWDFPTTSGAYDTSFTGCPRMWHPGFLP